MDADRELLRRAARGDRDAFDRLVRPHWPRLYALARRQLRSPDDAAVAAGATDVGGPSFDVAGRDELYRRALGAAVDDATAKARVLAAKAGVTLGRIASLTEGSDAVPVSRHDASPQSGAGVPIEPGQSEVTASVTAVFAVT